MTGRLSTVAAMLCLPAVAVVSLLAVDQAHANAVTAARAGALPAATRAAHDLLSYDYRTMNADIARAKAETTGLFSSQYAGTATQLAAQARQLRAIVQVTTNSPSVLSATASQVVVLVFVDQASVRKSATDKTPVTRIDQSRVRLTMTKVHGRWLVSQLAAL